jgi:hypothetical protein
MLTFISALGLDRVTTEDITLTATTIHIVITTGRIGATPITGLTIGTVDTIIITATIVTAIITDIKGGVGSRNQDLAGSKAISSQ